METLTPSVLFRNVAMVSAGTGVLALLVSPWVRRLTGGIR
jgi:hypothetical protein